LSIPLRRSLVCDDPLDRLSLQGADREGAACEPGSIRCHDDAHAAAADGRHPGQRHYPWPHHEALTIPEAMNDMALLVTGAFGKPLPKRMGAPIRLVVPWKFGFKNIGSIVKIEFAEEQPKTLWNTANPREYGFWANINPEVPHPRRSQASERLVDTGERIPTQIFNGYGANVADLYEGIEKELSDKLYR
jgi:DMSO/TMAO reductase YedYZ molybdopterin-dependent catalytic subunit